MIDLHTHSNASDGGLSPGNLMDLAASQGLSAIALTDHDTIGGLKEAKQRAETLGLGFIPGIEVEICWEPGEFHLLGLGIYRPSPGLLRTLEELFRRREERNLQILDRIRQMGVSADYEDILRISGGKFIGRPHFASFLVERRLVKNGEQAFSRFLGKGKALYVPKEGLEFGEALDRIKESGGIAVLAHPLSLYVSWGRLPKLLKTLKDQGLDGVEAWHPTAKPKTCRRLEELGRSLGLLITAGSDFHGEGRPGRRLGYTSGDRKIEDGFLAGIPAG
jgi:predicted metal-dependent phosphoesterase TrpH